MAELSGGANIAQTAFGSGYESLSGFQEALQSITGHSASQCRNTKVVHLSRILTPLGPMLIGATEEGVCLLDFADNRTLEAQIRRLSHKLKSVFLPGSNQFIRQLEVELKNYFTGALRQFKTPLVLTGSNFQKKVWKVLMQIEYGKTRSYAHQARIIGSPSAVRAVASANGDNFISIVIPCHRVVGSDGSLTGYGGGLWRKKWLLEHEGAAVAKNYFQPELSIKRDIYSQIRTKQQ